MGCAVIVVRAARAADGPARLQLVQDALAETYTDAFFYFFFQELTLQVVVLCGAVLFIFCGVSVWGCALLPPAAAALLLAGVRLHAASVLNNTQATLRGEAAGWVAERRGGLALGGAGAGGARVLPPHEADDDAAPGEPQHREIVGTISVSCVRGDPASGWVSALAVRRGWRRRGAGGALLGAAGGARGAGGWLALHAAVSHLQPAARTLLHKHGWECRGTYHRALLGDALTLPMAHLVLELPHA